MMSTKTPIGEQEIHRFVAAWYLALDQHAPIEEISKLLTDSGLIMTFPDGNIDSHASFEKWYSRVTNIFFDENHYVQDLVYQVNGDTAGLDVSVGWQASWWEPPSAKSKRLSLDASQKWVVRRSTKNSLGLEISFYNAIVQPFKYSPGFAHL